MPSNFYIITNNPSVAARHPALAQWQEVSVREVYILVRDAVHLGAVLISHPLAGSVKPNESPYRSVVLSRQMGPPHLPSVQLIEDALAVVAKLPVKNRSYPPSVLEDFRVIDCDLIASAMAGLPPWYHL